MLRLFTIAGAKRQNWDTICRQLPQKYRLVLLAGTPI